MNNRVYKSSRRNQHRRYRIKSPRRFITFLVIMICVLIGSAGFASGSFVSTASTADEYTQYTVQSGDTLWDIADQISGNKEDPRAVVHAICSMNDLNAEDLRPGMVLTVPADL